MAGRCLFARFRRWIIRIIPSIRNSPTPGFSHARSGSWRIAWTSWPRRASIGSARLAANAISTTRLRSTIHCVFDDDPRVAARGRAAPVEDNAGHFGGGDPEMQQGADLIDATMAYVEYFKDIAKRRRQNPKDDVATVIATSEIDGKPIGDFEAYSYYIALASAGHDTTSATIAGGLLALIENPAAMVRLQRDPEFYRPRRRRWCAGFRQSSTSSARPPRTTKFAARRFMQATVFSSATRRVIAMKKPSTVRSNSFPTGHPIGMSASLGIHACIAGTSPRPRSCIFPRIAEPD